MATSRSRGTFQPPFEKPDVGVRVDGDDLDVESAPECTLERCRLGIDRP
jgi:hypothetical protein